MLLKYGNKKFLLPGDATSYVENELTDDYNMKVDVLLVSHHGSNSASGAKFLKECSPQYAVISVGKNNDYGHPSKQVLNRLENFSEHILRTDKNGDIRFTTNGSNLKVSYSGKIIKGEGKAKLNKTKVRIGQGDSYNLKVSGTSTKVKWSSSNRRIADVNSKGKVTSKKSGTVIIRAKVGAKVMSCKVTVYKRTISSTRVTLYQGKTKQLKVSPSGKIKWSSSNGNIASVSQKGMVKAKNTGTATITARIGNQVLKCKVTVKVKSMPSPAPAPQPSYGSIIGNRNSHVYHVKDCGHLPLEKNRQYFSTEQEALNAGFHKCSYCSR